MRWALRASATAESSPAATESAVAQLARALKLSPVVARLLVQRGLSDPEQALRFLNPSLKDLHSPFLMRGMKEAVARLQSAIANKEPILIYGDYDVDGTLATVILKTAIELLGGRCDFHVPHRLREGYGMRGEVIERAAAEGVRLVISVDTGIRAFAEAETARRLGVDLIVTDHHLPHDRGLPLALAVLNPNDDACPYPDKGLSGAGVAFKLAQAMLESAGRQRLIPSFLKVAAVATVADSVPLVGENRTIVRLGLEGLRRPVNPGLKALMEVAKLDTGRAPSTTEVAFRLAPRINAAGRMNVAEDVVELLMLKDEQRAREIAFRLDRLNAERQVEEARINQAIVEQLERSPELRDAACIIVDAEGWHRGVIGICASRLVERRHRPAIVIAREGLEAFGSGRSIGSFHLLNAIETCADLFIRHGGHAAAIGFALPAEHLPELRRRVEGYARQHLRPEDCEPLLEFDAELALNEVTPLFYEQLSELQPFGNANPEPVFVACDVSCTGEPRVLKEKHLKLRLKRPGANLPPGTHSAHIEALGWRMGERLPEIPRGSGALLDVAFRIERNNHPEFGGGLQLILCDFRAALAASGGAR